MSLQQWVNPGLSILNYGIPITVPPGNDRLSVNPGDWQLSFKVRSSIFSTCACLRGIAGFEVSKLIVRAGAILALVLCAGTLGYSTLAVAMEEQHIAVPVPEAAGTAAAPVAGVQAAAPAAKAETGTEIRIPGLGKLGTLPKMDFGLELLYGAAEGKPTPDQTPEDKDNQDLTIRGSVKHKF
jgi:hypothetical protein